MIWLQGYIHFYKAHWCAWWVTITHLVWSHEEGELTEMLKSFGYGKKASEHTVHHSLLCSNKLVRVWRTEPRISGRRWPGIINHNTFYIMWIAWCMCLPGEEKKSKLVKALWSPGQCFERKPPVGAPALKLLQSKNNHSCQFYCPLTVASLTV